MRARPPEWGAGARLRGGAGLPCSLALFPGHQSGKTGAFSVLWAMALAFRRAVSNDNSTVFLWSQTSAEKNALRYFTTEGAPVFVWLSSSLESFHLRVSDLVPCLGEPSSGTVSTHTALFLEPEPSVLPSLHGLCRLCSGPNHLVLTKGPALIYYVLLTFHGLSHQLYFSMFPWNVFHSRCYQLGLLGWVLPNRSSGCSGTNWENLLADELPYSTLEF